MEALTHVLSRPPIEIRLSDTNLRMKEVRKLGQIWRVPDAKNPDYAKVTAQLQKAFQDKTIAQSIVAGLSANELAVLQAYLRYGRGHVSGVVMRMDLLARGLLEVREQRIHRNYTVRQWAKVPTQNLVDRALLFGLANASRFGGHGYSGYGDATEGPLTTYAINPIVAQCLPPAGPPSWSIAPEENAVSVGKPRGSAEFAFELARVHAGLAGRKSWTLNRSGELSKPAERALAKAVPLGEDHDFPLPDRHVFYFEILRHLNVVKREGDQAFAKPSVAQDLFRRPAAHQARLWVWGWLRAECWSDGYGVTKPEMTNPVFGDESSLAARRQILAWALACVAHQGEQWFDLETFVERLYADGGSAVKVSYSYVEMASIWDPRFVDAQTFDKLEGEESARARWLRTQGSWFANAVMVTLATLGFIERGRVDAPRIRHCFRLTPLGLAIFGAPEHLWSSPQTRPFLVVQPNFDVVAYLDQTDAQGIGSLALLLENAKPTLGAVQSFRITQQSYYQALELGFTHDQAVTLLQQVSQHSLPDNVLRTLEDWASRRESLVVHTNTTLVGFASAVERDAHVAKFGGKPCGDHWVILEASQGQAIDGFAGALTIERYGSRKTLEVNEQGVLSPLKPLDTLQIGRLHHFAERNDSRWQITSVSMKSAVQQGIQPAIVFRWLGEMLARPIPPLLECALEAWTGKPQEAALDSAMVLGVAENDLFNILAQSDVVRPMLLGTLGSGWFLVRPECAKDLARLLGAYGFDVAKGLTPGQLPRTEG